MRPAEKINDLIKKLQLKASADLDKRVHDDISMAPAESDKTKSAVMQPKIGRTIMKSPITKLAAAAVIAVAVLIGISQLGGTGTSVVWGEVVEKVQASRGLIYRESHPNKPDEAVHIMWYDSPTHGRTDLYKQGQIVRSIYSDYSTRDFLVIHYKDRCYFHHPMDEKDIKDHQRQMNLKDWIEGILSRQHTNLGSRTIEGVLCEGIETKYPIFGDMNSPAEDYTQRIWVSVKTGYPLLCEGGTIGDDEKLQVKNVLDQFQWDVELDASVFEPDIPSDYEQM